MAKIVVSSAGPMYLRIMPGHWKALDELLGNPGILVAGLFVAEINILKFGFAPEIFKDNVKAVVLV